MPKAEGTASRWSLETCEAVEKECRASEGTGTSASPVCGSGKSPTRSYPRVLGWRVPVPCYKVPHPSIGAEPGRGKTWRLGLELTADSHSRATLGGSVWGCRPAHGLAWVFHSCHWPDPTFSPLVLHLKPHHCGLLVGIGGATCHCKHMWLARQYHFPRTGQRNSSIFMHMQKQWKSCEPKV